MTSRKACHAGSWYSESPVELSEHLAELFDRVDSNPSPLTKAIISPHAGYRFCGTTSAWAYKSIDVSRVSRVFILGPSHKTYIDGCSVPDVGVSQYETPFGNLDLDLEVLRELKGCPDIAFRSLKLFDDEEEHSIEMQLPVLHYLVKNSENPVKIVPIFVGSVVQNEERIFGRVLARYFDDPVSLFIISSDFCHWGHRFRFTPSEFPPLKTPSCFPQGSMNAAIEALDRQGMDLIARQDAEGFSKYLQSTGNTICGRYPILILMEILRNSRGKHSIEFVHYSQSTNLPRNPSREDSSVSYAAGVCSSII